MKKLSFSKKLRLLTAKNFTFVFDQPQRVNINKMTILGRSNKLQYPRVGCIISKKNIKYSHERNRIKRLIRESFRKNQHTLPKEDFVIIIKNGIELFDNYALTTGLEKLWHRYRQLFHSASFY
ncbi:ribonuclease P protein component [Candidatus Erwinia haradaeae]|uniref:Ribonuclease P protein component n=1 Tax=Candidatus Erwinia haradaeae TaxID=1922217 RepID=A0A451D1Q0_9GAMM|nr:ribonuclease P protein component [Candidatus Erwinia haradaeae]VFP79534.1 Ribonuclease P protein component [Candidatus Erwinia haradaeae]